MNKQEIKRKIDDVELAFKRAIDNLRITFQYLARDEDPPAPAMRLEAGCEVEFAPANLSSPGRVLFIDHERKCAFVRLRTATASADFGDLKVTKAAVPKLGDHVMTPGGYSGGICSYLKTEPRRYHVATIRTYGPSALRCFSRHEITIIANSTIPEVK